MKNVLFLFSIILLFSCGGNKTENTAVVNDTVKKTDSIQAETGLISETERKNLETADAETLARFALKAFQEKNFELIQYICDSTDEGVQFTPYKIQDKQDRIQNFFQLPKDSSEKFMWGFYDGSGDSILLNLPAYVRKFVIKHDYSKDTIQVSKSESTQMKNGKMVQEATVEFKYPGSEKNGNMDWCSVKFCFIKKDQRFFLKAIIHDQWTI